MNFDAMPLEEVRGHNVEGLKEFLQNKNTLIWINYISPSNSTQQTLANGLYIQNLLHTEFLPSISSTKQPTIHVVDPQNPEGYPTDLNGKLIAEPRFGIYSHMGVTSFYNNGIINTGVIQIADGDPSHPSTWANPSYDQEKLRLFTRAICAPQEMTNPQYDNLTIFSVTAPTKNLSAIDKKLIKITEYYPPLSPINMILG